MIDLALEPDSAFADMAKLYLRARADGLRPSAHLEAAWQEFYRLIGAYIRSIVVFQGVTGHDVDDCIQDVWSEVIRRLPTLAQRNGYSPLRGWLFAVARSKAISLYRREKRRRGLQLCQATEVVARDADPATQLQRELDQAEVRREIERLQSEVSEPNAVLLQLRLIDGLDVGEVARRLGMTSQQVWYRQHRMLARLRARLVRHQSDGRNSTN
jgi:RNA polymerase sigma factor (sigma-70 family)